MVKNDSLHLYAQSYKAGEKVIFIWSICGSVRLAALPPKTTVPLCDKWSHALQSLFMFGDNLNCLLSPKLGVGWCDVHKCDLLPRGNTMYIEQHTVIKVYSSRKMNLLKLIKVNHQLSSTSF